jgi:hypothetical protein
MFNDWMDWAIFLLIIPAVYSLFLILAVIARWIV